MSFKINQFYNAKHKALLGFVPLTPRITECHFKDIFSGTEFKLQLSVTPSQIKNWFDGAYIQTAFHNLSPEVRELFITGLTSKEFAKMLET